MFNKYYKRYDTGIDEMLFGNAVTPEVTNGPFDPIYIDKRDYNKGKLSNDDLFDCEYY